MAVKTFTTGEVLTAADTNTYLNNGGMVYVTSQTIGSAVSSINVTSAFSSTYDIYAITVTGGAGSTAAAWTLKLGATATNYYNSGYVITYAGVGAISNVNNGTAFGNCGIMSTDGGNAYIILNGPNLAKRTYYTASYIYGATAGGGDAMTVHGYQNSATQFTDFTITFGGGTMTGGTVVVYGYRKA